MRCGPQSHVYQFSHTPDGFPPEGTTCMCGLETFYSSRQTMVTVSDKGICPKCKQPLDDHEGAKVCAV